MERYESLYYSITETGINIEGCDAACTGDLVIPETINDISVTSISAEAFKDCDKITSVSIPETVKTIGAYAFNECCSLETINISQEITAISEGCFKGCTSLKSINLNGITNIDSFAFENCLSLNIELPSSLTSLGERAFHHSGLKNITIPSSLVTIGMGALNWCDNITELSSDNDNFVVEDDVLYNSDKTELILYPAFKTDTIFTIPETVTTIGMYAFEENSYMEKIRIPYNITTIKSLCGLINIKEFEIYNGDEIVMSSNNNYLSLYTNSQTGKQYLMCNNLILKVPVDETIIEFAGDIMSGTFAGCKDLTEIIMTTNTSHALAYKCCYKCTNVEEMFFKTIPPPTAYSIEEYAFSECYNVQSITISPMFILGSGDVSIGEYAFYNCSQLNTFTHPFENLNESLYKNSSIQVKSHAFENCGVLSELKMPLSILTATRTSFNNTSIIDETNNDNIVSINDYPIYINAYIYEIEVPISNNETLDRILTLQPNVISIKLGDGITKVYDYMFASYRKDKFPYLETLILPDTVETIGHHSFYDATIKNINLSLCNIKTVGCNAFNGYKGNLQINLNNIEHIYYGAFCNVTFATLTDIIVSNKEKDVVIDCNGFYNCRNLGEINIDCKDFKLGLASGKIVYDDKYQSGSTTYTMLGESFFQSDVIHFKVIADNYYKSGNCIFYNNSFLEELLIQSNTTTCSGNDFAGNCYVLKRVIHSGSLGNYDYQNCYLLKNFQICGDVSSIGNYVFNNCYLLRNLDLSSSQITTTSLNFNQLQIPYLNELKLSPNMKSFTMNGYYSNITLNSLYVPEGVENLIIGSSSNCYYSLIDISIPSTLKQLTLYSGIRKISVPKTCSLSLRYLNQGLVDVNYY